MRLKCASVCQWKHGLGNRFLFYFNHRMKFGVVFINSLVREVKIFFFRYSLPRQCSSWKRITLSFVDFRPFPYSTVTWSWWLSCYFKFVYSVLTGHNGIGLPVSLFLLFTANYALELSFITFDSTSRISLVFKKLFLELYQISFIFDITVF